MGNIYFEQKKYDQAIKMYNMALDSTSAWSAHDLGKQGYETQD